MLDSIEDQCNALLFLKGKCQDLCLSLEKEETEQCNVLASPLSVRDAVPVVSFRVAAAQPKQPQPCHHVGQKLSASSLPTPSMLEKPSSKKIRFSEQQQYSFLADIALEVTTIVSTKITITL
jgi:hypothetical protein